MPPKNYIMMHNNTKVSKKEKTVLAYCDEQKIAEIAAIVINMNLWTRLKLAQGTTPKIKLRRSLSWLTIN